MGDNKNMISNKTLKWALFISLIAHSVIFFQLPRFYAVNARKNFTRVQVTYCQIKEKASNVSVSRTQPPIVKNPIVKENAPKIKQVSPDLNAFLSEPKKEAAPKAAQVEKVPASKVTVSKNEEKKGNSKLSKNPVYLSYTQTLHQKIRQIALKNCPKEFRNGAVFVSFTIASNGELKEVKVVDDKSNAESPLKDIAKDSIREAAPYPVFPESFNQPEITFNVIISFEA